MSDLRAKAVCLANLGVVESDSHYDKRCVRRLQQRFCRKIVENISGMMETRKYSDHLGKRV